MPQRFVIKQLSIFLKNEPGRLASFAKMLEDESINMFAFSLAEANSFGVVRAIVDRPDEAYVKLTEMGMVVKITDVIAVKMRDEPGGLFEIAQMLGDRNINIDYSYAYSGKGGAVLILRVDDTEEAIRSILEGGGSLLEASHFQ